MTELAALFELEELDADRYRSVNTPGVSNRLSLFGGLVLGQALRAAGMTVATDRLPHSLHGYFLRPGRVDQPVVLEVDRARDGGSFSSRHVRVVQDGKAIVSLVASFSAPEADLVYEALPTRVDSSPEEFSGRRSPLSVEIREVTPTRIGGGSIRHTDQLWVRAPEPLPDDPLLHACAVAYVTDLGCGFGQAELDGVVAVDGPSIGHSVWFHTPVRADEWMLLELWPVTAGRARGIYHGSLRNRAGVLVAALAQEMLLRERPIPPDVLERMAEYLGIDPPPPSPAS